MEREHDYDYYTREHGLKIYWTDEDWKRVKTIAVAVRKFSDENSLCDTTLMDFVFNIEADYQRHYNLPEDDWGYAVEDAMSKDM